MISSIKSMSVFADKQWMRSSAEKETDNQLTSQVTTDQLVSDSDSESADKVLSKEQLLSVMHSLQKPPMNLTAESSTEVSESTEMSAVTNDLSSIDADGDGTLSTDEYQNLLVKLGIDDAATADDFFAQYDTNSDGEISMDEIDSQGGMMPPPTEPPMGPPPMEPSDQNLTSKMLNAYETNYEYMFGTGSTETENVV